MQSSYDNQNNINNYTCSVIPGDVSDHLIKDADSYILYSPSRSLAIRIGTLEQMTYSVFGTCDQRVVQWINTSALGVRANDITFYQNATVTSATVAELKINYPLNGNNRFAKGHCIQAVLNLEQQEYLYSLEIRAYDNGVAFRYCLPSMAIDTIEELTTYGLRSDVCECWYGVNNRDYESFIRSYSPSLISDEVITAPLTAVVNDNGGFISIMEGALNESYPGVNLKAIGNATYSTCFYQEPYIEPGVHISGWRIINVAKDLNDLVNNQIVYTVNEAPDRSLFADTSWIESGRAAWSWCTIHRAPTYDLMKRFTVDAARLGYEYNIIDDGWPAWSEYKPQLASIGSMGEVLNVKQLLWCAITAGTLGSNKLPSKEAADEYFKLLEDTHMYGAKVDFWWSEANTNTTKLQKYFLSEAAKRKMIIDFHGCNKNTGLDITYPNELSREGVRGLECLDFSTTTNYSVYAELINTQLYTRFLCGHADWTPASYNAMEIASLILVDSPIMVVSTDPSDILKSPAAEFIKSIPSTWDKTVVLPCSKIGKYSVYAKEDRGTWFIGGIASTDISNASVDLSTFLSDGSYTAEVWYDTENTMQSKTINVTKNDRIDIGDLSDGKGFAIRISKLSLSRYGGEIGDISVTAPIGSTVKYTLDSSDPMSSESAIICNGSISINSSCKLRIAITDGDGKGTLLTYRFNKIDPVYTMLSKLTYLNNETTVLLSADDGATIYYTTDGSQPNTSCDIASEPIVFSKECTLRYLVVSSEKSLEGEVPIAIMQPIITQSYDLPLTDAEPLSTSVTWSKIYYDTSMAPSNGMSARPISLGGTNTENGTQFSRGISANSTAVLDYAVPKGYSRFVAVVGIDNCVFKNLSGCARAKATVRIAFDGELALETQIFRKGQFVYIDTNVPKDANVMTITFTDGGNGNTCDNVSMAMPGWIK